MGKNAHRSKAQIKAPSLYEVALKIHHPIHHTLNPSNVNVLDQRLSLALKDLSNALLLEAIPSTEGLQQCPWPSLTRMPLSVGTTKNVLRSGQLSSGTETLRLRTTNYNSIESAGRQPSSWEKLHMP